jgi:hypothetical protein
MHCHRRDALAQHPSQLSYHEVHRGAFTGIVLEIGEPLPELLVHCGYRIRKRANGLSIANSYLVIRNRSMIWSIFNMQKKDKELGLKTVD